MALQAPNLDDRTFQDLVREARAMIPRYCPEWTDHNLSDPGITLIELFAWMAEVLLYRLNKVPDKNYIKFMEMIGIQLEAPKPARADVLFRLSAPQPEPVTIPRGTEVATVRTETREAVTFTTDEDLTIVPPVLTYALTTPDDSAFEDCLPALNRPERHVLIFEEVPQPGNALYLGYSEDLSAQALNLTIESSVEGIGVDPHDPPLAWEFWDNDYQKWSQLRLEKDTTGGLNTKGLVVLHIPRGYTMIEVNGQSAWWIRCRAVEPREGQRPYSRSPKVTSINSQCIGGTVVVSESVRITGEMLGRSDGSSGQKFSLQNTPVLPRGTGETLEVEGDTPGEYHQWQEISDFSYSGPDDLHFTCDSVTGEIQFGLSIKELSGEVRQYGIIPPAGRQIRFTSYRCGGGVIGNVGPGTITVLKSSIPYVASVTNLEAARGGTEPETMEHAKMRAPGVIKACTRAVTADDFEFLALEASPQVARARCIARATPGTGQESSPGVVRLMLVPEVPLMDGPIPIQDLELTRQGQEEVRAYLDERRLLGTRLEIMTPKYVPITVEARIKGKAGTDFEQVAAEIERMLYRYINPVYGGPDGKGWPFGHDIYVPEIYAAIYAMENFRYIDEVRLFPVDPETGERGEAAARVSVALDSLICSHKHDVTVVE